jgi:hypothetical protein
VLNDTPRPASVLSTAIIIGVGAFAVFGDILAFLIAFGCSFLGMTSFAEFGRSWERRRHIVEIESPRDTFLGGPAGPINIRASGKADIFETFDNVD